MTSAPTQAAARLSSQRSTTPSSTASVRDCGSRSTPTTSRHRPLSFNPLANEPPIKPRPTTTRRPITGAAGCSDVTSTTRQYLAQRLEKTAVFGRQTNAHPQVMGHAVTADRANDDAFAQQAVVHGRRLAAQVNGDEVGFGGNPAQAHLTKPFLQLLHAGFIELAALRNIVNVVQRGAGRSQREAVDIEWLTDAV